MAFALNRNVDFNDLHKALDEENIKVGAGRRAALGWAAGSGLHQGGLRASSSGGERGVGLAGLP